MSRYYRLLIIFLSFLLGGCSREYTAERSIWQVQRQIQPILLNPQTTPDNEYQIAIAKFRQIIQRFPATNQAALAYREIVRLLSLEGRLDSAELEIEQLKKAYPGEDMIAADSLFILARAFLEKGDWSQADKIFGEIERAHPHTAVALVIPFYSWQHYRQIKDEMREGNSYTRAVDFYRQKITNLLPAASEQQLAYSLLLRCYREKSLWSEMAGLLDEIITGQPPSAFSAAAYLDLALLYEEKLNQPSRAKEIYQKFLHSYPRSPLRNQIEQRLKKSI